MRPHEAHNRAQSTDLAVGSEILIRIWTAAFNGQQSHVSRKRAKLSIFQINLRTITEYPSSSHQQRTSGGLKSTHHRKRTNQRFESNWIARATAAPFKFDNNLTVRLFWFIPNRFVPDFVQFCGRSRCDPWSCRCFATPHSACPCACVTRTMSVL